MIGFVENTIMKKVLVAAPLIMLVSCQTESDEPATEAGNAAEVEEAQEVPEEVKKPAFDVSKPESLVGFGFEMVEPALKESEVVYRVVERDGEAFPVTMDYRADRLNFKIKDGVITAVNNG